MNILHKFLMSSWLYYIKDESVLSDEEYDSIAKELLEKWEEWRSHQHAHLITKGDLEAGSLYAVREASYPLMIRHAAVAWWEKEKQKTWRKGI